VLGSERLTGATLDRLTHRCRIIETKGESYRLQDAKSRARRPKSKNDGRAAEEVAVAVTEAAAEVVPELVDNPQAAV
jgi:hypothetical protein